MYTLVKKTYDIISDRELSLNAAALSFYTIFAVIPFFIIIMGVVSYLDVFTQMYKDAQDIIFENFLPVNQNLIVSYIDKFLEHSLKISLFSFFMLFISSLLFFQNYEYVVNNIFKVKQRSFLNSLGVYILIIFITPTSLAVALYISANIASAMASNDLVSGINISTIVPNIIVWVLFFILFKLSANVRVGLRASLISSLIVAVVFSIAKEMFIYYVFLNESYTTLYGSFSILMFLFLWIFASWYIFLQGLILCYHMDRIDKNQQTFKK